MGRYSKVSKRKRRVEPRFYGNTRARSVAVTRIHMARPEINFFLGSTVEIQGKVRYRLEFDHVDWLAAGRLYTNGVRAREYDGKLVAVETTPGDGALSRNGVR